LGIFVAAILRKSEDVAEKEDTSDVVNDVTQGDISRASTPTKSNYLNEGLTIFN